MLPSRAVWSIERSVGRLVEIRIWSPVSIEETIAWQRAHDDVIAAIGGPYVCLVDLVDATVFPQEVVDAYVATMKNEPLLIRTATLLNQSPTLGMQIQRMIKEADHPDRRVFRDAGELAEWLDKVLDDRERERLNRVLFYRRATLPPPR
ncbi:hypothetical protein BH09MYX1_BH09MYX1_04530 [soil metagenome]